jgi:aspartokinase-like uncharacterized kinase
MAQTAHLFHALEPRLTLAADETGIRRTLHSGQPALWLPFMLLRDGPDMLTSWEVTSDSLALWLARMLNAERLVLVKACKAPPGSTLSELTARGVLDARFERWASQAPFPIEVVDGDAVELVRNALLGGSAIAPLVALESAIRMPSRSSGQASLRARGRRKPAP